MMMLGVVLIMVILSKNTLRRTVPRRFHESIDNLKFRRDARIGLLAREHRVAKTNNVPSNRGHWNEDLPAVQVQSLTIFYVFQHVPLEGEPTFQFLLYIIAHDRTNRIF